MQSESVVDELPRFEDSGDSNESLFGLSVDLKKAYHTSLEEGSSLPLLKEELRLKIQHRRLVGGQDELVVIRDPPKPDLLTIPEVLRKNRRRTQNRQSAGRTRDRDKEYEKLLLENITQQEKRNTELELIRDRLIETKKMLRNVLNQHTNCFVNVHEKSKTHRFISLLDSEWRRQATT